MRRVIIALLIAAAAAHASSAQQATFYISRPNCAGIFRDHVENPFDYTHFFHQEAIAWDAEAAVTSLATGVLLKQIGAPLWVAGALPTIGFGLVPHLVGWRTGQYQIDVAHWAFVLVNRATPAVWAATDHDTKTRKTQAVAMWLAADLSLSCFDR